MAFAMAIMKKTAQTFKINQIGPGISVNGENGTGDSQPPRNRIVVSAHIVMIATYSASMNSMYGVEEYSTMKPATSSDSASTRSKGGRFVSASAEMKKMTNIGNSGSQYQPNRPKRVFCAATISPRLRVPAQSRTVMMTKPIETSYEIICAAERSADRNGYLEFDAQPPIM